MITPENIVLHEMIGLRTEIVNSTNNQIVGLKGTILNETKSMFVLDTENGIKSFSKKDNDWKFSIKNHDVEINGKILCKRPEDRLGLKL